MRVKKYFIKNTVLNKLYQFKEMIDFIEKYERWNLKKQAKKGGALFSILGITINFVDFLFYLN